MPKQNEYCNKENSKINNSDIPIVSSDESLIEASPTQTPVKKKLKRIRKKGKSKQAPFEKVPSNETQLLEELIKECNRYTIQSSVRQTGVVCSAKNNISVTASMSNNRNKVSQEDIIYEYENQQEYTVQPQEINNSTYKSYLRQSKITTAVSTATKVKIENKVSNIQYRGITEHIYKPSSKNYHNLYVFYLIKEVLRFTPNNFPKNNCVQLIGLYNYNQNSKSHLLYSSEQFYGQCDKIQVDFREVFIKPGFNKEIILFGTISFDTKIPIVVVKFFQLCSDDVDNYVELMLRLRTTVPQENFDMVCVSENDLKCDESMDNEDEDAFLNSLSERLSQEEGFQGNDLSDSELCAFLDEISFEKL